MYAVLFDQANKKIAGIIAVSCFFPKNFDMSEPLKQQKRPFLDIIAAYDYITITSAAQKRKSLLHELSKEKYQQTSIIGADHYYSQMTAILGRRIESWLVRQKENIPEEEPSNT